MTMKGNLLATSMLFAAAVAHADDDVAATMFCYGHFRFGRASVRPDRCRRSCRIRRRLHRGPR